MTADDVRNHPDYAAGYSDGIGGNARQSDGPQYAAGWAAGRDTAETFRAAGFTQSGRTFSKTVTMAVINAGDGDADVLPAGWSVEGPYHYAGDLHTSFVVRSPDAIIASVYAAGGDEGRAHDRAMRIARMLSQEATHDR